jgi:tight adherence protein C
MQLGSLIPPFCLLAVIGVLALATYRRQASLRMPPPVANCRFRGEAYLYAVAGALLRWTGGYTRFILNVPQLVRFCAILHGRQELPDPAFAWTTKAFTYSLMSLLSTAVAWLAQLDPAIIGLLAMLTVGLPLLMYRELQQRVKKRQEAFVTELPSFMHKLSLLLSAGETVQRAWVRAGTVSAEKAGHPLYSELTRTNHELAQSVSFPKALEELHRRCGVSELSTLVTTVLMNYRRGGEAFTMVLQDTARVLMERKYALIRTKGEEASTKLLFPMLLMLLAVMLIVAAPAVMMMN